MKGIRNIEVCKLMTSLVSKGFVEEQFVWQHLYWTLNDAGIEYMRENLNIPSSVLPATKAMQNKNNEAGENMGGRGGYRGGFSRGRGRGGYGGYDRPRSFGAAASQKTQTETKAQADE